MLFILTLNWSGSQKLQKLAPTLLASLEGLNYKWLIKDNNSQDDSIDYINNLNNINVNIIKYTHNRDNFSQGCNFLFKETSAKDDDLILLLNNDIIFNDTTSIKNMISLINNDKDIGAVGAKLNFTNTNKLQHAGVIFDKKYNMLPYHYRPNEIDDNDAKKNREFQALTGAVLLTRANIYKEIGGADSKFHWAFDDVDLCFSIKYNLKKKIIYCGNTNISHDESFSLKKNPVNKLFMPSNIQHFLDKWKNIYKEDHYLYLKDSNHNIYKGKS